MCYATYNKIDILFKINDNDPQLISQVASFLQTKRFLTLMDGTYRRAYSTSPFILKNR